MKPAWKYSLVLILCSLAMGINQPGFAQSIQGTILGSVTDQKGAVVPGASIVIVNRSTLFQRTVVTDGTGHYRVASLEPGSYTVAATLTGFKHWESNAFPLAANEIRRVDVQLEIGSARTTVTVSGTVGTAVNTESATLSNLHTSTELTQMPLSIYGRSSFNVLKVTAAVQSANGQMVVNGARDTANAYTIDGVSHDDMVSSRQAPNNFDLDVDGIQQIKVQTADNSAEYSQVSQFLAISKSGGNQYHGSLFWGNFNSYFSTRDFFDYTSQKPSFTNNNEFAATLGGPVIIPKLYNGKDKTFFFFSYGGQRYRIGNRGYVSVPTDAFRNGDFSAIQSQVQIRDPQTGTPGVPSTWQPFPGNIIPSSRISSVSKSFQTLLYPEPNRPGTGAYGINNNFTFDPGGQFNNDVYSFRVDQKISDRNTMFVRVGITPTNQDHYPGFLLDSRDSSDFGNVPGRFAVISDTHSFSPNLVNEARMGFVRLFYNDVFGAPLDQNYVQALGLQGLSNPGNIDYLNALPAFRYTRFAGASGSSIFRQAQNTFEWTDNMTWIHGRHTFKWGGDIRRYEINNLGVDGTQTGSFGFDDAITGFDYASFLLGVPTTTSISTPTPAAYPRSSHYGLYIQDDMRVNRKLTLNYGIRYEYQSPWADKYDRTYTFNPSNGNLVVASSTMPSDLVPQVAATLPIETATQAGYPVHTLMNADRNNWNPRVGVAYRPFSNDKTVLRLGYGWYTQIFPGLLGLQGTGGPWQTNTSFDYLGGQPTQSFPNPFTQSTGFQGVTSISVVDPSMVNERAQQWNVSAGQELWGTAIDVAYVGTMTTRVPLTEDLNLLHPSTTPFDPANRPYQLFSTVDYMQPGGQAIYHGLTVQAERRFKNGLQFNVNYAWAKALTDASLRSYATGFTQNQYDYRLERAPDTNVRNQQLVFDYIYELPVGHGKAFLSDINPVLDGIIGGWEVLGITTLYTGQYLDPSFSGFDPANTNQFSGRPDCVGNANIGSISDLVRAGQPMWNLSAFSVPQAGRGYYGNCARSVLIGPGKNLWNAGLSKNFLLREGVRLQIQWELFNAWNHPNFGNGDMNITSGSFGITSSGGGGRQMLFGARLDF
ncbi:MAG TPA: carboxypeptidase regulatory-like domain-containing protein [Terriglobia bacterium]|nr:carboxypeptidase regulatory-like domain-containing protein [Terriglobia bacterium]